MAMLRLDLADLGPSLHDIAWTDATVPCLFGFSGIGHSHQFRFFQVHFFVVHNKSSEPGDHVSLLLHAPLPALYACTQRGYQSFLLSKLTL
jgi:hypothetical protein